MDDTTTVQNSAMTLSTHDTENKIVMDVRTITKSLPPDRGRIVDGMIASIDATDGRRTR